jgi:hypothetical protein
MQSESVERELFEQMKITFQSGKGNNHLVPVLIPTDTVEALRLLTNVEIRESAGVSCANEYVFPSTKCSDQHISGWHAISRVCSWAKVEHPERLTATKMRHRISTLYAALDVSESDRQLFYKHMGHSSSINANIYQTPLAEAEVLKVGSQLQKMDGCSAARGSECNERPSSTVTTEPGEISEALTNGEISDGPSGNVASEPVEKIRAAKSKKRTLVELDSDSEASSIDTEPRDGSKKKKARKRTSSESDSDSDFEANRPLQAITRGMRHQTLLKAGNGTSSALQVSIEQNSTPNQADSTVNSSESELLETGLDSLKCTKIKQQKPQGE